MKFIKNNLKVVISFIVGVILASSLTVYAYSYLASDIKYTDDKTVAYALDELYTTSHTTITNLTEEKNQLETELNSLSTASKSFSFVSSTNTQTFNLGFKPKYISCIATLNNSEYETIIYNYDFDSNHVYKLNTTTNGNSLLYANAVRDISTFFTINDNGFTWNLTNWNNTTIYCTVSK